MFRRRIHTVADGIITRLSAQPLHPLTLSDLCRHGRPPLSPESLLSSANFTLSILPTRLAHRISSLRNLPYIVVSNPHIHKIYQNYLHSLSTLLPFAERPILTLSEEETFTNRMSDLVETHRDTIPTLARGFRQVARYIDSASVERYLDEHLRARIGTRLVAEQQIALHRSSNEGRHASQDSFIGVIDTALRPADIIRRCETTVAEICELNYGVRPFVVLTGDLGVRMAYVPMHLEYVITELLKNAFRAVIETGKADEGVEITIAPYPISNASPGVTIRIRDKGGGISPENMDKLWSYGFTTFDEFEFAERVSGAGTGAGAGAGAGWQGVSVGGNPQGSTLAGLGYGLPLARAYAEYFGGGIAVQSLWGWGTDVYLTLRGVGGLEC
ncbi:kinase isozyme 4 [Piedraia hortae CBS 480.64]|uniref:Protein-serine/threonine kinase n=1 Tax=Piedraia hortae CBS 480.64 TaxID=1314780 RepID=A0A6A7C2B3_9PEZI|nr:kinase isozyme 4 [Piedraia hortae CBS 480.64]